MKAHHHAPISVCVASVVRVTQVVHPAKEDITCEYLNALLFDRVPGLTGNPLRTGNLTESVIWSCLELNIGLMSACIPSLLPFFKRLAGKRTSNMTKNRAGNESRHDTNLTRASRFSRMAQEPDEISLQRNDPQSSSQATFEDNFRLVDPKPNEIIVTNQIIQSHELKISPSSSTTGKDQAAPSKYSWS